ncbi:MAG: hypothetical protein KC613_04240, partial [Myxococcales bacterium]|nr:hypothetical protein [Myxococcales bacterium]
LGAGIAFAVGKPVDDASQRTGSASAGALDVRVGHGLGPCFGLHLRGAALFGLGQAGDHALLAGTTTVELSARPWLLTQGPLVLRGGLGLGGARVTGDPDPDAPVPEQGRSLGWAVTAGATYELGWTDGLLAERGWALGPAVDVTWLPGRDGEAALTWVSVGLAGSWYGG